jgi:hypothetical protein
MTLQCADANTTGQRPFHPHPSRLLPGTFLIGAAFLAASLGLLSSGDSEAVATPENPVFGSITGSSPAIGERPFAYLEFDWPDAGVPGFEPLQEPFRLVTDASAG